ncbi:MAG: ABC transporter ATP-binding protein [Firmicutes bacterium]|nr:ABC transporter ATP-binding protein [Bacillota bacterium]
MYIKMENINFRYKGNSIDIIDDLSLSINKGETVCILGESGSGKSSILRLLAGLEEPYDGYIEIDKKVMKDSNIYLPPENRGIGMVFQDYALFPHMTVAKNITYGFTDLKKAERRKRLNEVMELVDIKELADRYPYQLSGGQQQRVALARAIAPQPRVLLLDEPFSNLDANLKDKIREKLKEIIKKINITTILVSHDIEDALNIADRLVIIKEGQVIEDSFPKSVIEKPKTEYIKGLVY